MENGFLLMYVMNGEIYPIRMTKEQFQTLQLIAPTIFEDKKVTIVNKSQGKAINLIN